LKKKKGIERKESKDSGEGITVQTTATLKSGETKSVITSASGIANEYLKIDGVSSHSGLVLSGENEILSIVTLRDDDAAKAYFKQWKSSAVLKKLRENSTSFKTTIIGNVSSGLKSEVSSLNPSFFPSSGFVKA